MSNKFSAISPQFAWVGLSALLLLSGVSAAESTRTTEVPVKIVVLDPKNLQAFGIAARNGTGIYSGKGFYVCPAFTGYESVMRTILDHIDTDYVLLGDAEFGADKEVEFIHMDACYGIKGGFESIYSSSLTLVRSKGERDWKGARVFLGPEEEIPRVGILEFLRKHSFQEFQAIDVSRGKE